MLPYNWQQKDWPMFSYSLDEIKDELFVFAEKAGKISGTLHALSEDIQMETVVEMMVYEAIKTSEIEGEYLSRKDVVSSVKKNLGLKQANEKITDKKAEGIGELMINVHNTFKNPLSRQMLFAWHKMVMRGTRGIKAGEWRAHTEPMQVVSGAIGKQKVHFEAPPSERVNTEMEKFIDWFNATSPNDANPIKEIPVRAAIAHLYFESIHPFEDGNGRIGRAIAEKALSQGLGRPILISLSRSIEARRNDYYNELGKAQRSNKITEWVNYFVKTILIAQDETVSEIDFTLKKVKFFDRFKNRLNTRQLKVIKRMLTEGPKGFEGGMNAGKYVSLAKTSKATATRDLQHLLEINAFALIDEKGGRSTKYKVNI